MIRKFKRLQAAEAAMLVLMLGCLMALTAFSPRALQAQGADNVWIGIIEATPAQGRTIGLWTVSEKQFAANARTEFDAVEGALVPGTCVRVDYRFNAFGGKIAEEIDSEPANYCRTDNVAADRNVQRVTTEDTEIRGSSADNGGGEDRWLYARIDAMPAGGLIGEWTIGGVTYVTSRNTFFAQEEGRFRIGACVDVEYIEGNPRRAVELKTESAYECR